jgi:hypothetical protein
MVRPRRSTANRVPLRQTTLDLGATTDWVTVLVGRVRTWLRLPRLGRSRENTFSMASSLEVPDAPMPELGQGLGTPLVHPVLSMEQCCPIHSRPRRRTNNGQESLSIAFRLRPQRRRREHRDFPGEDLDQRPANASQAALAAWQSNGTGHRSAMTSRSILRLHANGQADLTHFPGRSPDGGFGCMPRSHLV